MEDALPVFFGGTSGLPQVNLPLMALSPCNSPSLKT